MKKSLAALVLALILSVSATACTSNAASVPLSMAETSEPRTASLADMPALSMETTASGAEVLPAPSEEEAREVSLGLYAEGYTLFIRIFWSDLLDRSQSFEEDGRVFYRVKGFETRRQLEEALGAHFSQAFVDRNMPLFFDKTHYVQMMEKDGVLYITEGGGLGGTYELYTGKVMIENLSGSGWTFKLYGYDFREDKANEDLTWTFHVVEENGRWAIDSMDSAFSDGSGDQTY